MALVCSIKTCHLVLCGLPATVFPISSTNFSMTSLCWVLISNSYAWILHQVFHNQGLCWYLPSYKQKFPALFFMTQMAKWNTLLNFAVHTKQSVEHLMCLVKHVFSSAITLTLASHLVSKPEVKHHIIVLSFVSVCIRNKRNESTFWDTNDFCFLTVVKTLKSTELHAKKQPVPSNCCLKVKMHG